MDLGTKGSGTTPWSRGGDGRLTLKGGVREILATEMLEALGVNTSHASASSRPANSSSQRRALSDALGVLVRLGHSHVRFGTFQRLAPTRTTKARRPRGAAEARRVLRSHLFPDLARHAPGRPRRRLPRPCRRSEREARAEWMTAGFCHGVLNTDNMTITGDSFDYGPYRFVPTFDPDFVAAYFDPTGLYAFGKQPSVVSWNLSRLADALRRSPRQRCSAGRSSRSRRVTSQLLTAPHPRAPGRRAARSDADSALAIGDVELPRVEQHRPRAALLRSLRWPRRGRGARSRGRRRTLRRAALDGPARLLELYEPRAPK